MKFVDPPNIGHANLNSRLDLFGIYGPVLNWHSVDKCLCKNCGKVGKGYLSELTRSMVNKEKVRLGIDTRLDSAGLGSRSEVTRRTGLKVPVRVGVVRLLKEDAIIELWDEFCGGCKNHLERYSHLVAGRQQQ